MSLDEHVIIFSQWDNLLKEVGIVLNEYELKMYFVEEMFGKEIWLLEDFIQMMILKLYAFLKVLSVRI